MSQDEEKKIKKMKIENEDSSESRSQETSSSNDTNSSYLILEDDGLLSEDSSSSGENLDYFASSSTTVEDDVSQAAWVDSDEDSELRDELEEDALWINSEGIPKAIERSRKEISFNYTRKVFTARCKVKIFRCFPHVKVLVDSFNLIYMIRDFETFKTFKISLYKISDVCYFNGRILFSSDSSSYLKEVTLEGEVTDIKKGTGNIKKMVASENYLYIVGDKLFCLNKNLSIKSDFNGQFVDACLLGDNLVCLKDDGDIYCFDQELAFREKHSFSFKFQFKHIFYAKDKLFIATENGLVILNSAFKQIKAFSNLSEPITCFAFNSDFVLHASAYQNSFRILKNDLSYFEKFPYSKIKINPISTMDIENDTVYFSDSRFISSLKINYID